MSKRVVHLRTPDQLAQAVIHGRTQLGLNQEELARRADVEVEFVRDLEAREDFHLDKVIRVLHAVGLDPYTLPSVLGKTVRNRVKPKTYDTSILSS